MTSAAPRTLPEPFIRRDAHCAIALRHAEVLFTTRRGGVSAGPYASLNLGRFTHDDPRAVGHNRRALADSVGRILAYGRQVHGTHVRVIPAGATPAAELELPDPPEADGQATARGDLAPMVLTADCLPIAIAGEGAVTMLHAGWRGLAGGVIGEGVRALRELGASGPLEAAIGPGAGPCCYQVSEDLHAVFACHDARHRDNLDLKAIARAELELAGVGTVHDIGLCTICADPGLFYSHRRDHGLTGRQAGIAWLS
jgi:purine-nucleoside/S-methyl-5'-thioadenosine phosphorylase / adenosine deaminase